MATAVLLLLLLHTLGAAANVTYCWGSGSTGQLGDGKGGGSHTQPLPTAVASGPEFAAVSAGAQHTCGLTAGGQAYCWGQAIHGELGVGKEDGTYLATPALVAGNLTFTGLALGDKFTCGIADSKAYCWGSGESGRLGSGSNTSSDVPLEVAGNHSFVSIALGQAHACAVTPEGPAWCWGEGFFGQLGDNSTNSSALPVRVAGNRTFVVLAAGDDHTCGLLAGSREPMCWGSNTVGQLGTNTTNPALIPTVLVNDTYGTPYTLSSLAAGSQFTCGIGGSSAIYCWGENDNGQIGPVPEYGYSNQPLRLPGTQRFASVSTGRAHACGVDSQAAAFCWGAGMDGQLGTGTQGRVGQYDDYSSTTPLPVAQEGGSTIPFYAVSAGGRHTCGVSPRAAAAPSSSPGASPFPSSPATSPGAEGSGVPTPPPPSSSSSFPVGAVVGAVVGAAVVAVLAFFALRPGRGWLLKRRSASLEDGTEGDSSKDMAPADGKDLLTPLETGELDSFLVHQFNDLQPAPLAGAQSSGSSSLPMVANSFGTASDPLLLYISSFLASHTTLRPEPTAPYQHLDSGSGNSNSGASSAPGGGPAFSPETHMWQLRWDELQIERPIGHGSFGAVYKARWQETTVAVKVLIDKDRISRGSDLQLPDKLMQELEAEAAVMIRMRHPNVVQFMGLCQVPPALVTEYCARGSLYSCLQAARANPSAAAELTWARRLSMAAEAATGLLYLHMRDILHRDVKSPNFLCDQHFGVKVSDFNLSRLAGPVLASSSTGPANPIWLAPELMRGGRATTASDVFSFGVVLWELLTWRLPWAGSGLSPFQIGAKVVAGERLEVPPREALPGPDTATFGGLDAYCELLQECWAGQPERRPGMAQVVRRLRALLEACGGGGSAGQAAGGGGES